MRKRGGKTSKYRLIGLAPPGGGAIFLAVL
jgi:hypothetical protein